MRLSLAFIIFLSSLLLVSCNNSPSSTADTTRPNTGQGSDSSTDEPILITSDDPGTATIKVYRNEDSDEEDCYIAPRNVNVSLTYQALSRTLSNNQSVCPSIGDVNLLVIPVHLPGSEEYMTSQVKEDIEKVFFSEDDEDMGFLSVKEFYAQSSYGKLNFSGEVTDWFDVAQYTDIDSADTMTNTDIYTILKAAVRWARETQNIDLADYDADVDGYIDAVWLVYDHLDFQTEKLLDPSSTINQTFWNLTGWDWDSNKTEEEIDEQVKWGHGTSAVSWASFDSMYTSFCEMTATGAPVLDDLSSIPLDSHTFIHETGHLLGLDDYYSTDSQTYRPAGCFTMMDQNVGDIDPASKMMLGWVTPYVVYGPSEILIRDSSINDHQVIVIPSNYDEINDEVERQRNTGVAASDVKIAFNPFSEYLIVDLYAPTFNNASDSTATTTINNRQTGPGKTGVRIYHADTRIFKFNVIELPNGRVDYRFKKDDYIFNGEHLEDNQAIIMPISNNVGQANIDINGLLGDELGINFDGFDELRLIEATGTKTFDNGYYMSDATLFDTETMPFNMINFGIQFFNGYTMNDGSDFPFTIDVETLKEVI